jgi:hypothetical protein
MESLTAKSRVARAAAIITESPLAAAMPSWHAEAIAHILSSGAEGGTNISVDFRSHEAVTTVSFYVNTDSEGFETDEKGDSYFIQRVSTSTSWPSHGSASPELNAARLAFMTAVNDLAGRVSAAVDGTVRTLHRTAAEVAEAKAAKEQRMREAKERRIAEDAIGAVCRAMRVGSKRDVPFKLVEELKDTAYTNRFKDVALNGKTYNLGVYGSWAEVTRVS